MDQHGAVCRFVMISLNRFERSTTCNQCTQNSHNNLYFWKSLPVARYFFPLAIIHSFISPVCKKQRRYPSALPSYENERTGMVSQRVLCWQTGHIVTNDGNGERTNYMIVVALLTFQRQDNKSTPKQKHTSVRTVVRSAGEKFKIQ